MLRNIKLMSVFFGMKKTMKKITRVKVLKDYCLHLVFDDGVQGVMDLSDLVGKGAFEMWRDRKAFKRVRIGSAGELVWGEEIDLCPDLCISK